MEAAEDAKTEEEHRSLVQVPESWTQKGLVQRASEGSEEEEQSQALTDVDSWSMQAPASVASSCSFERSPSVDSIDSLLVVDEGGTPVKKNLFSQFAGVQVTPTPKKGEDAAWIGEILEEQPKQCGEAASP